MDPCGILRGPMKTAFLFAALALACAPVIGAGPSPSASPAGLDPELDPLIDKLPAVDPGEGFARLEDFVQAEDEPDAAKVARERARRVLARFADIQRALPPPAEKHAGELAQLLFTIGRALEEGGVAQEALPVYERIVRDYPRAVWEGGLSREPIADQAQARLRWHREKHPWVQKDLATLTARVRASFVAHDRTAIAGLISRIGFWSGPFASEGGADDPERVLKLLEASWPGAGAKAEVAAEIEAFSDKERQVFLKVSGFTGEFPEVYCILEREADGWQWSGVAFTARPGAEPSEPEPDASASPGPASSARPAGLAPASPVKAPASAAPAASPSPKR